MNIESTPIQRLKSVNNNELYIKRDDLIPFSFGGNKARKAQLFFREIDAGDYDCVVTYGSSSSNHGRVIANMATARGLPCFIIAPQEASGPSFNAYLMRLLDAEITVVPIAAVHDTIEQMIADLRRAHKKPYFIPGGGHGDLGTQAYVDCYREIRNYERQNGIFFDLIFHASGTGTTQAGLVCGKLLYQDAVRKIVGISIARKNPRGRTVIVEAVKSYLGSQYDDQIAQDAIIFTDDYTADGYGKDTAHIRSLIRTVMSEYGIPLDPIYTGKAFYGMLDYIAKSRTTGKNVLFIHTGGTPLYFDFLAQEKDS